MAHIEKKTDYQKKYPGISEEILAVLLKSDRKMEYQQYDLKAERFRVCHEKQTIICIPSREDSYERLLEENRQFTAEEESVEDIAVKTVMIEKMLSSLKMLSSEDQDLIAELFFEGKSEHQVSTEIGIPRMTIHNRKNRILARLKKLIEK